jgi:hypothetical protein
MYGALNIGKKIINCTVNIEINLLSLINSWLNKFC